MEQESGSRGANVLVLSAADHRNHEDETCVSLLTDRPLDRTKIVSVMLTESPERRLGVWSRHSDGTVPRQTTLIDASGSGSPSTSSAVAEEESLTLESLSASPDLTTLGVKITTALNETDDGVAHVALCFHSLTPLLQRNSTETVYRFLHTLVRKGRGQGVLAHYHMDPTRHDDKTVETFKTLFDTVVRLDDGAATVIGDASVVEFA